MDLSFIVPVYNTDANCLKTCIDSIINFINNDKKLNCEIVIVNDGSDNIDTIEVLKKYKKKTYIKIINQSNHGVSFARNVGIKESMGKYVSFIDSDDIIRNVSLDILEKNYDIICFDYKIKVKNKLTNHSIDEDINIDYIKENILYNPLKYKSYYFGAVWGKIINRDFLIKNNLFFDSECKYAEDRLFFLKLFNLTKENRVCFIKKNMYIYILNELSVTHKFNMDAISKYKKVYDKIILTIGDNNPYDNFLLYGISCEVLAFTAFNKKKHLSVRERKNIFLNIYDKFNLKSYFENFKFDKNIKFKTKIKLLCLKFKLWIILFCFS